MNRYLSKSLDRCEMDRNKYTALILNSPDSNRIVAAGPGTGKTHLFKQICNKEHDVLILSFINELVNDIKKELEEYAEIRTLHSFALKLLRTYFNKETAYFVDLNKIIEEDYKICHDEYLSFEKVSSCLLPNFEKELEFYSTRRRYYNCFGPFCSIYTLIKVLERGQIDTPLYSQILVDEYQDFNKMEIRLIDLLAKKNRILIVGDDDQSLYNFKYAKPKEIRKRFKSKHFSSFELPYCSRCPEVLVRSTEQLVKVSKKRGFLNGRIDKKFKYFPSEEKNKISSKNPKIVLFNPVYHGQVAKFLGTSIMNISGYERKFSVLVICTLRNQIPNLEIKLRKMGFTNIETPPERGDLSKIAAYQMLINDDTSNVAWRILSNHMIEKDIINDMVKRSFSNKDVPFQDYFDLNKQEKALTVLGVLKKLRDNKELNNGESELIFGEFDYDPIKTTTRKIKEEVLLRSTTGSGYRNVPIKIVTLLGAKGLTRDYVFLVNFNDRFVLDKGKATDKSICSFLVALTRARKRLTIYNDEKDIPTFLQWIGSDYYDFKPVKAKDDNMLGQSG